MYSIVNSITFFRNSLLPSSVVRLSLSALDWCPSRPFGQAISSFLSIDQGSSVLHETATRQFDFLLFDQEGSDAVEVGLETFAFASVLHRVSVCGLVNVAMDRLIDR